MSTGFRLICGVFAAASLFGAQATILDRTHYSQIFHETRNYRIFLPPDYESSGKRYPVIYWFHGWSERYNKCIEGRNYDQGSDYGGDNISNFVGDHDVIVVKWDGHNPRTPGEHYLRPYNISPVETNRQFPLYFPELVSYIDAHYRTIPDREHRATAGLSMGGFMSYWVAGKYPDLVSSASNFMGSSEFFVGPRAFPVEYRHTEMHGNYDGMRTRIVLGTRDFIQFYHRRMNLIWDFTRPHHEMEEFDSEHGTPGMAKTLVFHMRAFADPLPRPEVWNHIDVYPNFSVWGWKVETNRTKPGFTVLENVSSSGFRSCVREWVPAGRVLTDVHVEIVSAPLYRPESEQTITTIRLGDGKVHRTHQKADSEGRLHFNLDGERYETGIGAGPILALTGDRRQNAEWAEDGRRVDNRVRVWNKGARASMPITLHWETPNPGIRIFTADVKLPAIQPGHSVAAPLEFTVADETREIVKAFGIAGSAKLPLEIPTFPPAPTTSDFQIADGRALTVFQHAIKKETLMLGEGNGNGQANAGERIAVLLPDGDAFRAAELFTNDACVDLTDRFSDVWSDYDHVGASSKYTLAKIRPDCPSGHELRMVARELLPDKPNHHVRYVAVEVPVGACADCRR
ncbi:MAG TPA: alpha/beta hydrolase-fold protein [Bryobacteraceae bacterium]|nr:alpha/beta hydrolase-fold protein [Bryobacteraceae bacterium]